MSIPKVYFAIIRPGGEGKLSRTALGYIPENYQMFANFMRTKLNHPDDYGNTYRLDIDSHIKNTFVVWDSHWGSKYTFNEFFDDMDLIGYEVVQLPFGLGERFESLLNYVGDNYNE